MRQGRSERYLDQVLAIGPQMTAAIEGILDIRWADNTAACELEDDVGEDNPVHVIDAIVDELDLGALRRQFSCAQKKKHR